MIPKKIHYCWFGKNTLREREQKCIQSWKKYLPDWEIIEWNETNYNIERIPYVKEAYDQKKWAFVSDVARLEILYKYGGLYLDTDVELIKPINEIIKNGDFMGIESYKGGKVNVNPGLIIGVKQHNPIIKDILDSYDNEHFLKGERNSSKYTIVERTTKILIDKYGLKNNNCFQKLAYLNIYPSFYFCPMDYKTGNINITNNTYSIHWYSSSWLTQQQTKRLQVTRKLYKVLPLLVAKLICPIYLKFGAAKDIYKQRGIKGVFKRIFHVG